MKKLLTLLACTLFAVVAIAQTSFGPKIQRGYGQDTVFSYRMVNDKTAGGVGLSAWVDNDSIWLFTDTTLATLKANQNLFINVPGVGIGTSTPTRILEISGGFKQSFTAGGRTYVAEFGENIGGFSGYNGFSFLEGNPLADNLLFTVGNATGIGGGNRVFQVAINGTGGENTFMSMDSVWLVFNAEDTITLDAPFVRLKKEDWSGFVFRDSTFEIRAQNSSLDSLQVLFYGDRMDINNNLTVQDTVTVQQHIVLPGMPSQNDTIGLKTGTLYYETSDNSVHVKL